MKKQSTPQIRLKAELQTKLLAVLLGLLALAAMIRSPKANAGNGRINADGTIDVSVSLRWPPTASELTTIRNQFTAASQIIWDATEGQLRFGEVTFTSGSVSEDEADMWIDPRTLRSGVSPY